jgi:ubiquinol-cytochrome c reductase cytochrome c1 subunit
MNYNPFFPGGAISMARVLFDGLVEYEDGKRCISGVSIILTMVLFFLQVPLLRPPRWPRTLSLSFIGPLNQNIDERKKIGLKAVILFSALTAISLYVKRAKWAGIKTRKICTWGSDDRFVPF